MKIFSRCPERITQPHIRRLCTWAELGKRLANLTNEAMNAKCGYCVAYCWPSGRGRAYYALLTFFAKNKLLRRRRWTKREFSSEKVSGKAERPSEKFDAEGERGRKGLVRFRLGAFEELIRSAVYHVPCYKFT